MNTETYSGTPIPDGWFRVRVGVIQAGDRALGADGEWIELPGRYAGGGVGMFSCVIRKVS